MSATVESGTNFLLCGISLFLVAAGLKLVRDSRGMAFVPRCHEMARRAWGGFVWLLPSRKWVKVVAAFVGVYVAIFGVTALVCYGILRWYVSTLPVATEAYEGFGDAMLLLWWTGMAFCGCQFIAFVAALVVTSRIYDRLIPAAPVPNA